MGIAAIVLTWATTVLVAVWWAAGDRSEAFHSIGANRERIERLEGCYERFDERQRAIRESLTQIQTTLEWIRKDLEKRGGE